MRVARLIVATLLGASLTALMLESLATAAPAVSRPSASPQATNCEFTATLAPAKDNTLYESADGSLSNGAGPFFFVGRTGQIENFTRRGLLAFDLAAHIPPGSTVLTTTLVLTVSRTAGGSVTPPVPQVVGLHRLTADWGEGTSNGGSTGGGGAAAAPGDATWIHRFYTSTVWSTPGGDFIATASATQTVGTTYPAAYTWTTSALWADVQGWLNAPNTNFGWLLRGDELTTGTAQRIYSREAVTDTRPSLVVQYRVPQCAFLPLIQK